MGTTFDIVGKLGAGGMADVFLARMTKDGRTEDVALKRIRETLTDRPEVWAQFQREAAINGLLEHPAIVRVRGVGSDDEGPWLALEYVAGATAAKLIGVCNRAREAFPAEHALCIARDAAEGLAYAHAFTHETGVGVVHRDVSPDNLLVGYDGRTRVSDFGIARLEGHTRFTRTGEVRGKIGFLAPELIEGAEPSTASDVFAFAATLFKLFSGVAPFRGNNDGEVFRSLMLNEAPDLAALRPDLPGAVTGWVQRALAKTPEQRPALVDLLPLIPARDEEQRAALGAWVKHVRPPSDAVTPAAPRALATSPLGAVTAPQPTNEDNRPTVADLQPTPERRLPVMLVLGVLVLGGGVFAGWKMARGEDVAPVEVADAGVEVPSAPDAAVTVTPEAVVPQPEEEDAGQLETAPVDAGEEVVVDAGPGRTVRAVPRRGSVDIRVTPFADVFIDGKLIGTTPIKPQELSPGPHKVLLVHGDQKRTSVVNIEAGKRSRLVIDFAK